MTETNAPDNMGLFGQYLRPTRLCDFDTAPEIGGTAKMLAEGWERQRQKFDRIFQFVKGLPYGLEDWNVKASDTLRKGWGMCSGKSNLLVAMSRSLGIPARYRIIKIKAEGTLWRRVAKQDSDLGRVKYYSPQTTWTMRRPRN
jgi:transglutaminase-like putative cysteine protease